MKKTLSLCILVMAWQTTMGETLTSDSSFFAAVNLDYPGLEAVEAAVRECDFTTARKEFVSHLKTRNRPAWFIDWRNPARDASYDTGPADRYASNLLTSVFRWHQFDTVVDWDFNPTENDYPEWVFDLNRHRFWKDLGEAYHATGDEKYARAFVGQLRSWIEQNPLPSDAANRPGSCWRTIDSGFRMTDSWSWAFFYFLSSPNFRDDDIFEMVKSFYEHGLHLRSFPTQRNWLTVEMSGLFRTAILFPEFKDSREWADYAVSRLLEQVKQQFYPDGAQIELTPTYHGLSVYSALGICDIAALNGYELPKDYVNGLKESFRYYVNIIMPDFCTPAVNDAYWDHIPSIIPVGAKLFPDVDGLEYIASERKTGKVPGCEPVFMPWAGWGVMRSGWDNDALYAFFDAGPFGASHQHEDKLSFLLSAYGRKLLTEFGTYSYDDSPERRFSLSAGAHNVTRVDGMDQNRRRHKNAGDLAVNSKPQENRLISCSEYDFLEGEYSNGFGPQNEVAVTHYRALSYVKKGGYWLVFDIFSPSDEAEHTYESWFHFNSSECVPVLGGFASSDRDAANLSIIPLREDAPSARLVTGQKEPEIQGVVNEDGHLRPVGTACFRRTSRGVTIEPYIFFPSRPGEAPGVKSIKEKGINDYRVTFSNGKRQRIRFEVRDGRIENLEL